MKSEDKKEGISIKDIFEHIGELKSVGELYEQIPRPYGAYEHYGHAGLGGHSISPVLPDEVEIKQPTPFELEIIVHRPEGRPPFIDEIEELIGEHIDPITQTAVERVVERARKNWNNPIDHHLRAADKIIDKYDKLHFDNYKPVYKAVKSISNVPIYEVDLIDNDRDIYGQTNGLTIQIKERSIIGMLQTHIHEEAHCRIHYPNGLRYGRETPLIIEEVEANIVTYVISTLLGTDPMLSRQHLEQCHCFEFREEKVLPCIHSMIEDIGKALNHLEDGAFHYLPENPLEVVDGINVYK